MNPSLLVRLFLGWIGARAVLHNGWWLLASLFMVVDARLTPAELLIIAAAQGVAAVIFEVPAGVFADAISRKGAIVIAHALMGTAMITTGLFGSFWPLLLSQMLWGISWTFSSGADVAWITDELDRPAMITSVLTRQARWQLAGAAVGMITLGGLGILVGRQTGIVVAGVAMLVLGVVVAVTFPERNFTPVRTGHLRAALGIARRGARLALRDRTLFALVIVTVLVNGAADSFGRIYPVRLAELGFPSTRDGTLWFTLLGIAGLITGALALLAVERRIEGERGARTALIMACGAAAAGLTLLALAPNLTWAVLAVLIASGAALPLIRTVTTIWVNRRATSDVRATVHSFLAQAEYVGEIACTSVLAAIAGLAGLTGALLPAAGLFLISILVLTARNDNAP
ncbi:MFS transporter [Microlunatus parietis]|uniref:MFS family permease n=1 Tax=Microlunatus parietis TaxID=682979 RepID=A0A7Y9LBX2_9ACTN|nr:MFS transporter [Microlunatus parietis]NYE74264.1 MFS family permease [Microlunatus parietis]